MANAESCATTLASHTVACQTGSAARSSGSVALVTGANKGIGKEIARGLIQSGRYETVLLGCRDEERGQAAVKELQDGACCSVACLHLDVVKHSAVAKAAAYISQHHNAKLALLVNNAGLAFKGKTWGADQAEATLAVNFRGTKHMTEAMLPALRAAKGIVINVASTSGYLGQVSASIQSLLQSKDLTQDKLEELSEDFVDSVRDGSHRQRGWSGSMYGVSKLLAIASGRLHADQEAHNGVAVYSMCPGYCVTDMTSGRGSKTPAQGAETALFLAAGGGMQGKLPTGAFFADCKQITW